jgi:RNA polymerase sigma factor (TIGR02999 family)
MPVTQLLAAVAQGDAGAREKLWSAIYAELRRIAQIQVRAEAPGHTLQPTALVHEAYLRLTADPQFNWANRRHFFAAAALAMRRIRIDDARSRKRLKRGGGRKAEALDESSIPHPQKGRGTPGGVFEQDPAEVLAIDEALTKLEEADPRKAEVVNLRYFAGLTVDETAETLGVSPRTVDNEWKLARAWLYRALRSD